MKKLEGAMIQISLFDKKGCAVKRCTRCKIVKPISGFNFDRYSKTGMTSWCKSCAVDKNRERIGTEDGYKKLREYRKSDAGRASALKANKKFVKSEKFKEWWRENKQKYSVQIRARNAARENIKSNGIIRDKCEVCGSTKSLEAHHGDYNRPLDVTILCKKHHEELHHAITKDGSKSPIAK